MTGDELPNRPCFPRLASEPVVRRCPVEQDASSVQRHVVPNQSNEPLPGMSASPSTTTFNFWQQLPEVVGRPAAARRQSHAKFGLDPTELLLGHRWIPLRLKQDLPRWSSGTRRGSGR